MLMNLTCQACGCASCKLPLLEPACAAPRRYPGGLFGLYPARVPQGGALEIEAGAVLANDLLRRYRVRYSGERRVQSVTLEEFWSPAQPGTR